MENVCQLWKNKENDITPRLIYPMNFNNISFKCINLNIMIQSSSFQYFYDSEHFEAMIIINVVYVLLYLLTMMQYRYTICDCCQKILHWQDDRHNYLVSSKHSHRYHIYWRMRTWHLNWSFEHIGKLFSVRRSSEIQPKLLHIARGSKFKFKVNEYESLDRTLRLINQ
jgi:hypothetical protein